MQPEISIGVVIDGDVSAVVSVGLGVVRMLKCHSPCLQSAISSRTRGARGSEGTVSQLFILQGPLCHTIKNEREYINQQHIYSASTVFSSFVIPGASPDDYKCSLFICMGRG